MDLRIIVMSLCGGVVLLFNSLTSRGRRQATDTREPANTSTAPASEQLTGTAHAETRAALLAAARELMTLRERARGTGE